MKDNRAGVWTLMMAWVLTFGWPAAVVARY